MMPTTSEPPAPHWLPSSSSSIAATVSAYNAAPGLRMMMAASGPANNQNALRMPSNPGVTAPNSVSGAVQMKSHIQKTSPEAAAMAVAVTRSTTRHRRDVYGMRAASISVLVMEVPFLVICIYMVEGTGKETSVRRHYPIHVHAVEARASSQPAWQAPVSASSKAETMHFRRSNGLQGVGGAEDRRKKDIPMRRALPVTKAPPVQDMLAAGRVRIPLTGSRERGWRHSGR